MGVILDDLWDHEGYGARRLADGTHTGMWSLASASFEAYVASCGSGWQGAHLPTELGNESAVEEWEDDHARPLLARTVPDEVRSLIRDTEQSVSALLDERSLATWAGATVDRLTTSLGATAPGTIAKGPGRQPPGRALGL